MSGSTFDSLALDLVNALLADQGKHPGGSQILKDAKGSFVNVDAVLPDGIGNLSGPAVVRFTRFGVSKPPSGSMRQLASIANEQYKGVLIVAGENLEDDTRDTFAKDLALSVPWEIWDLGTLKDIALKHPEAIPGLAERSTDTIPSLQEAIETLEAADLSIPKQVFVVVFQFTLNYYGRVLAQADNAFNWAVRAAILGTFFFILAIAFVLVSGRPDVAIISVVSGALIEVISLLVLRLYGETAKQLSVFHLRLDDLHRSLLANSFCESLVDMKDETRSHLIDAMIWRGGGSEPERPYRSRDEKTAPRRGPTEKSLERMAGSAGTASSR